MKRFLSILIIILTAKISAQETLPVNQQYLLGGKFLINPAYYGETDDFVTHASYQKQFSKFDQSPNVQTIGIHTNISGGLGAGVAFFRDENGPVSANGITAGASYFIPLGDRGERTDQFSFGIAANFYNSSIDESLVLTSNDPALSDAANSTFLVYANLGGQFSYHDFFAGFSVLDIPLTETRVQVNGIEPSPTKFLINAGYSYALSDGFALEPSVLVNLNSNSAFMTDINLLGKIYDDENSFSGGVSFRTAKDQLGSQRLSISPVLKAKIGRFNFGASYGFGLSDVSSFGGNSFSISLGYNFENFVNPRAGRW